MTAQMCDFFIYNEQEYCLMGYTGGKLPTASDFQMQFLPGSTADARGHCMWLGIQNNSLIVERIEIRGEEITPIAHKHPVAKTEYGAFYDVGKPQVNLTGYILFSEVWQVDSLYYLGETSRVYEAEVYQGTIAGVSEISEIIRSNVAKSKTKRLGVLWEGQTKAEQLASVERIWDLTAALLPRRYDVLYKRVWYVNFREQIARLREEVS